MALNMAIVIIINKKNHQVESQPDLVEINAKFRKNAVPSEMRGEEEMGAKLHAS